MYLEFHRIFPCPWTLVHTNIFPPHNCFCSFPIDAPASSLASPHSRQHDPRFNHRSQIGLAFFLSKHYDFSSYLIWVKDRALTVTSMSCRDPKPFLLTSLAQFWSHSPSVRSSNVPERLPPRTSFSGCFLILEHSFFPSNVTCSVSLSLTNLCKIALSPDPWPPMPWFTFLHTTHHILTYSILYLLIVCLPLPTPTRL